jgi:AcrR family transcriptional regulator
MLTSHIRTENSRLAETAYSSSGDPLSKQKILRAALHLFAQRGVHAVTVREIAAEAGYTNPALFKFFATKDALAMHLFERCYLQLFEKLRDACKGRSSFEDRLEAILEVFFSQIEHDADAFLFIQDHVRVMWPHVSRKIRKKSILSLIRSVLQQGVRKGEVIGGLDIDLLVAAITGTLQQYARMVQFGEFKGQVRERLPEMAAIIRRIVKP